jgi:hypothetical protein
VETKNIALSGLRGWRTSVADAVAPQVAKRSSLGEDQIRAAVGAIFLVLSLMYVLGALRDVLRSRR